MRFRAGLLVGFGAGYYLGAMAGRQRYEQINRTLAKVKRSPAFDLATDKAKDVVEVGAQRARDLTGNGSSSGHGFDFDEADTDPPLRS